MAESLATLRKAAKFYGSRLIFKDVSLNVEPGQVLLVAGANGAGKSTLLRVLAGLSRLSAGGADWSVEAGAVGYVAHQTFIYPQLTGLENLRFWARMYNAPLTDEDIEAKLAEAGLARAAVEKAGKYSRGMAQRLSLARAFMTEPKLILLDEPSTGLDRRSLAMLGTYMAAAKERGAGLVWVSHDVERDMSKADAVAAIAGKRLAYLGPPEGLDMSIIYAEPGSAGQEAA